MNSVRLITIPYNTKIMPGTRELCPGTKCTERAVLPGRLMRVIDEDGESRTTKLPEPIGKCNIFLCHEASTVERITDLVERGVRETSGDA